MPSLPERQCTIRFISKRGTSECKCTDWDCGIYKIKETIAIDWKFKEDAEPQGGTVKKSSIYYLCIAKF